MEMSSLKFQVKKVIICGHVYNCTISNILLKLESSQVAINNGMDELYTIVTE